MASFEFFETKSSPAEDAEKGKRQAIRNIMSDASLTPQQKQVMMAQLMNPAFVPPAPKEDEIKGDYTVRTGNPLPEIPASLVAILNSVRAQEILWKFDCTIEENSWANAYDVDDHFNFDIRGDNEVMRFATQGTGSFFGLHIGKNHLSAEQLQNETPVVHIDSEGSATRVAHNLHEFWRDLLALNSYYSSVVSYAGSDFCSDEEQVETEIRNQQTAIKELVQKWRSQDQRDNCETEKDVDFASADEMAWLTQFLLAPLESGVAVAGGVAAGAAPVATAEAATLRLPSDNETVDAIFQCDFFSGERWRPKELD
jgi:hypothetical protein